MAVTITVEPGAVSNVSSWTVTSDNDGEDNFRIKAELIISAVTVAVKWQPAGTLSWNFKRVLWALITSDVIDFDSLNIQTPNSSSYETYTIKFTEYWEDVNNALVEGDNITSDPKYIYKVDVPVADFASYNLSADDELFLTERPTTKNKIRIKDNLVTGWTNRPAPNNFDVFTASGRNITSAEDSSAVNMSLCYSDSFGSLAIGDIILVYCDFAKSSGDFPRTFLSEAGISSSEKSNTPVFTEGYNYKILIVTSTITNAAIKIMSSDTNQVIFEMSHVYVSKAYNELDYLAFISEETSLRVDCLLYDVDDNSLGSLNLDAVAITGERGVMPVSAILFTHSTTQVEKIILKMETAAPADRSIDITFERDSKCYPSPVRIEWLNKYGAFDPYTFLADYDETRETERKYYKNTSDVEQILDITSRQSITAYSLFETQTMLDWLKTIQDSKKVYWIVDNVRIEVVVINTSQLIKKQKQRNRISLTFRKIV